MQVFILKLQKLVQLQSLGFQNQELFYIIGFSFLIVQKYCPHALGDLSKGTVVDGNLICPMHTWTFSLKDGHCINHDSEIFIEEIV